MTAARKLIVAVPLVILAIVAAVLAHAVVRERPAPVAASTPERAAPPVRVYFVGNSFTFVNDLPGMLKALAASDGIALETKQHTPGGAQLVQQASNPEVKLQLKEHWDFVVLQEQSQLPSIDYQRKGTTEPALRTLMGFAGTSRTVLYETWGYRNGDGDNVKNDTYDAMQERLDDGFGKLRAATAIDGIPVNRAWRRARQTHPEIDLWSGDGRHPAPAGTYLAACVFYNTMLKRSPNGNAYTANLDKGVAAILQDIATSVPAN